MRQGTTPAHCTTLEIETMKSELVRINMTSGRIHLLPGYAVAPGLVVHRDANYPRGWNITHTGTGCAIFVNLRTRKAAIGICKVMLLFLADWTLPGDELRRTGLGRVIRSLRVVLNVRG